MLNINILTLILYHIYYAFMPSIYKYEQLLFKAKCEEFLQTLPHEDIHSQNSFEGGTIM